MSLHHQDSPPESIGQSPGCDPKTAKRNSGLFAFLKWFKPSTSRESIDTQNSSSCDSLNSTHSSGTVASFSYVPPGDYTNQVAEKCIVLGPETDTYKARLKQRDKRRENDKNVTLRKKYNLFFNRETLLKTVKKEDDENSKSLPLMTRPSMDQEEEKAHRRTNSESSKTKKAGAYLHVKGKRRAPQPPGLAQQSSSTMSLRRKKRLAPAPPSIEKIKNTLENANTDIIFNDSLKLDHGILKPAKEATEDTSSARSSFVMDAPVSPRPWYKRTARESSANKKEKESHKYEPVERLPEVQYVRNSTIDLTLDDNIKDKKKVVEEKRKSGMSFLTNISELDREASEIVKKEHQKNGNEFQEIPQFMRPKDEPKINTDSWISPKRRSAKDLIAKFNAITNVTRATVFGVSQNQKKDYFGKRTSLLSDDRKQESLLESHKKRIEQIDRKLNNPLMKSESASAIKPKPETPKVDRKNWKCPKCSVENDYWRIICHVCSTIKPYFDDFSSSAPTKTTNEEPIAKTPDKVFERAKTQIGFSALASYNLNNKNKKIEKSVSLDEKGTKEPDTKSEEREKLKKMLIEMKNSLPKRKSNILMKQNSRQSVIVENPETVVEPPADEPKTEDKEEQANNEEPATKTQEEKVAEIIIGTTETIYENIKVKKIDNSPKPVKVSASAQTSSVVKKILPTKETEKKTNFELMRPKDFENIYTDSNAQSAARIYANLARNDELSLFFNMPKRFNEIKNSMSQADKNTDTIEINRLLRRLETAIAKGELTEAASFAKELAQLKVNCSVIRQKPANQSGKKQGFNIEMYVEDKISHRGPFPLEVTQNQTLAELKKQVEQEFEIPVNVQRWILGKELATDDSATLKDHNITTERCPVFLYLVAPDPKTIPDVKIVANKDQEAPSTSKLPINTNDITGEVNRIPKIVDVIPKVIEPAVKTETSDKSAIFKSTTTIDVKPVQIKPEINEPRSNVRQEPESIKKEEKQAESRDDIKANIRKSLVQVRELAQVQRVEAKPEQNQIQKNVEKDFRLSFTENVGQKVEVKTELHVNVTPATTKKEIEPIQNLAQAEEDFEDYDSKTLKPPKEWECHLCTLLNPVASNVCAVCATVRLKEIAPVAPSKKSLKKKAPQPQAMGESSKTDQTYLQLVNLDNKDLVENREPFECVVCFMEIAPGEGVTLRECLHQFCKICLAHTVEYTEDAEVKCPYRDNDYSCNIALQDREIKALVTPQVYDNYLAKSVTEAENKIGKSFHCKTPDCRGWCIFEDNVNEFRCPVCRKLNCLTCQAIHTGLNCKQYQEKMNQESEVDEDARRTKEMVDEMVRKGEALTCPTCQVILMKKWGCDWVRCSMCKTEICWVTRGPRWGPAGKGDTSGGCQCGVNGVKCHPQCSYCH
ncbi:hypothetical protein Zmor_013249 [Zophobas morio]|uniref:RanBP-type and C3HC4-type zinc finger-containing protein 1 n=1 Tax=Zophobas morio TaxID=2755281 RepID=A0AA38MEH3_9CUCU|nr:hypothetical protein Zmor_013249 [Zophobas morio]